MKTVPAASKPTYSAMVTKAIVELKEKKGSSRSSIMKYLVSNYKLDPATAQPLLNKTLAKLSTAGKAGSGCYKLSAEEKEAIKKVEKAALKKIAGAAKKSVDVPAKKAAGNKAKKGGVKESSGGAKKITTKAKVMKKVSKAAAR